MRLESVSTLFVSITSATVLENHWNESGVQAMAPMLKVAVKPTKFVWLCGWLIIRGGV